MILDRIFKPVSVQATGTGWWRHLESTFVEEWRHSATVWSASSQQGPNSLTWRPGTGPRAPPWATVIGPTTCLASANRVNNAGGGRVDGPARELCK